MAVRQRSAVTEVSESTMGCCAPVRRFWEKVTRLGDGGLHGAVVEEEEYVVVIAVFVAPAAADACGAGDADFVGVGESYERAGLHGLGGLDDGGEGDGAGFGSFGGVEVDAEHACGVVGHCYIVGHAYGRGCPCAIDVGPVRACACHQCDGCYGEDGVYFHC